MRRHPDRVRALVLAECVCNTAPLTRAERLGVRLALNGAGVPAEQVAERLEAAIAAASPR